MARNVQFEPSRTLTEFRLLPGLTTPDTAIDRVSLRTPLVRRPDRDEAVMLKAPVVAAAMQSVSGARMGIELAKHGGVACIYASQPIDDQAAISVLDQHGGVFDEGDRNAVRVFQAIPIHADRCYRLLVKVRPVFIQTEQFPV